MNDTGGPITDGLILLASYPKSGNTWLRAFLASLLAEGRAIDINGNLAGTIPGAKRSVFEEALECDSRRMTAPRIAATRANSWAIAAKRSHGPLWVKVHDVWPIAGTDLPPPYPAEWVRCVLHVVRDPRDVAISFAHHFDIPIDEAILWMADETAMLDADLAGPQDQLPQILSSWSRHVQSWHAAIDMPVVTIRYEDMHERPQEAFRHVADALRLNVTDAMIAAAAAQSCFGRLRDQELSGGFVEAESASSRFFRQGRSGGWRDVLEPGQAARIVADHGAMMHALGYPA